MQHQAEEETEIIGKPGHRDRFNQKKNLLYNYPPLDRPARGCLHLPNLFSAPEDVIVNHGQGPQEGDIFLEVHHLVLVPVQIVHQFCNFSILQLLTC